MNLPTIERQLEKYGERLQFWYNFQKKSESRKHLTAANKEKVLRGEYEKL